MTIAIFDDPNFTFDDGRSTFDGSFTKTPLSGPRAVSSVTGWLIYLLGRLA